MAKRALFVATVGIFFGFERNDMKILQEMGYEVHCAANFSISELNDFQAEGIVRHQINFARSPWSKTNMTAYRELKSLMEKIQFDLVHCHTPMGGVLARLVSKKCRKNGTKVIYTAHGFHFFKGAPLKNWLLYFPVEWILAHWTDVLITINKEDYRLAKRFMKAGKVEYIPGVGIDTKKLSNVQIGRNEMRQALGAEKDDYILLSVGELSKRKNVSVVIKALSQLNDPRLKYYICGIGPEEETLKELIQQCDLAGRVRLLGFRSDIRDLLGAADLFVFPSLQEGLPVALMEAIATRTPVICSDIRGNTDLITEKNLLFDPQDDQSVMQCLKNAMDKDMADVVEKHYELLKNYDLKTVSEKMSMNYNTLLQRYPEAVGGVMALYDRQAILQELGLEGYKYILLSVGELSSRKNQETVIKALYKLHRSDILYLIAGVGYLESKFRMLIQKYGLEKQVYLLGHRTDVGKLCDFADIFVHISVREGLGMAPLEAMAKGMPLISSYVNGIKDYTLDGITGYCVYEPANVKEVAGLIQKATDNREDAVRHSRVNRAISELFSIDQSENCMRKIYGVNQ